jgi:hypothetical protein
MRVNESRILLLLHDATRGSSLALTDVGHASMACAPALSSRLLTSQAVAYLTVRRGGDVVLSFSSPSLPAYAVDLSADPIALTAMTGISALPKGASLSTEDWVAGPLLWVDSVQFRVFADVGSSRRFLTLMSADGALRRDVELRVPLSFAWADHEGDMLMGMLGGREPEVLLYRWSLSSDTRVQ